MQNIIQVWLRDVGTNDLDCDIILNLAELQLAYYVDLLTNNRGKIWTPLSSTYQWVK